MKKVYSAPAVEISIFDNADNTNTQIMVSGTFSTKRASGVGSSKYRDMFDY